MVKHTRVRPLVAAALLGTLALGACTSSGGGAEGTDQEPAVSGRGGAATGDNPVGGAPPPGGQTRAEPAGAIGPGNAVGTSSVNPLTESTKTIIDSMPPTRPTGGPGSD